MNITWNLIKLLDYKINYFLVHKKKLSGLLMVLKQLGLFQR